MLNWDLATVKAIWPPLFSYSSKHEPLVPCCGGIIRYVFLSIRHLLAVNYIKAISVQHINEWSKDLRCSIFLYASQNINHVGDSPKQYINTVDLRLVVWSGCCKTTSNSLSDENVFLQGLVLFAWPLNKWLQGCFFCIFVLLIEVSDFQVPPKLPELRFAHLMQKLCGNLHHWSSIYFIVILCFNLVLTFFCCCHFCLNCRHGV